MMLDDYKKTILLHRSYMEFFDNSGKRGIVVTVLSYVNFIIHEHRYQGASQYRVWLHSLRAQYPTHMRIKTSTNNNKNKNSRNLRDQLIGNLNLIRTDISLESCWFITLVYQIAGSAFHAYEVTSRSSFADVIKLVISKPFPQNEARIKIKFSNTGFIEDLPYTEESLLILALTL